MDIKEISKVLRNILRVGVVSSVNPAAATARVTFADRDDMVSKELHIGVQGAHGTKHYWVPHVGEQVLCAFNPNDRNLGEGYILLSLYNTQDTPPGGSSSVRMIQFDDGTIVKNDGGAITVEATGSVTIKAPSITIQGGSGDIVVDGVSLVNHTHGGVIPGGSSTAPPNK
jgi:phage baseplate assembly protein V